jgi:hypothetical protein
MKTIIAALLASCVVSLAQKNTDNSGYVTNADLLTPFTLTNSAGGVITNAVLAKLTPNKFIYKAPGGVMGVLRLDSLSKDLQEKFGYNPANALAADIAEKEEKEKYAAKQVADAAYLASLNGTNRIILITSIDDETHITQCAANIDGRNKEIFIRNLPSSVKDFVNNYNELRADILALGERVNNDAKAADRADAFAPVGAGGDAAYVNAAMAQRNRANQMALNANDEADNLTEMEDNVKQMFKEFPKKAAVIAYPSSEFWGDQQVWVCTGIP